MNFALLPVIDQMLDLYRQPPGQARFEAYLALLHGDTKGDMALPVGGYNPMAKAYALGQLEALKAFGAEAIVEQLLPELDRLAASCAKTGTLRIAIALSDDLHGGWTNRYTSDYDSKFRINALLSRNFCTPVFWTGESYSEELIRQRIQEYALRSIYRQSHPTPVTLEAHVAQERFVGQQLKGKTPEPDPSARRFYREYKDSDDYHIIFNFLYGSDAAESLCFPVRFGLPAMGGFHYALSEH